MSDQENEARELAWKKYSSRAYEDDCAPYNVIYRGDFDKLWCKLETLRAENLLKEKQVLSLKSTLRNICDEWDEDCEPSCDKYGHDEECRATDMVAAKKALRIENQSLKELIKQAVPFAELLLTDEAIDIEDNLVDILADWLKEAEKQLK